MPFMVALVALAPLHPSRALIRTAAVTYAIVVAVLIAEAITAAGNRRVGWIMLLGAHAFWFAIPACVQSVVPDLWFGDWIGMSIHEEHLALAAALIGLFLLCGAATYWLMVMMSKPASPTRRRTVPARNTVLLVALLILGLLPYFVYAASSGGAGKLTLMLVGRADKPWRYETFYAGASTNTVFWISQASLVASGSLGLLGALFARGRKRRSINALVAFVAIAVVFLDQGTRSLTAMLVMPPGLVWMFVSPSRVVRKALWAGPLLAFLLLVVTQLQFYLRSDHDRAQLRDKSIAEVLAPRQHSDFFTETAIAASIVPEERDYTGESPEWIILTNIVPRSWWEGKPVPQTIWVYSFYRWGRDVFVTGGNALPSVVGQYYMGWGWAGVVWAGVLFGACFGWLERIAARAHGEPYLLLVPFTWMVFLFVAFRYLAPGFHYSAVLLSFVWLVARRTPRSAAVRRRVPVLGGFAVARPL
ncbi:MAG: oligosaccharide repeat unit polymerase [Deltaproteobacteria bacterium]|nr:MAG: oligosaccharide repeat unit polymerase [Deltaproteobacteria bacterium]